MSLAEFKSAQAEIDAHFATSRVFASLVPLVVQMYDCVRSLGQVCGSATLGKLLMLCHREFLVAASLTQSGLPYDAGANVRRAIEIARVALALKRDPENAHKWLQADIRQARWDARQSGEKLPRLQSIQFPEVESDPLFASLKDIFGIESDMHLHFTPEFLGIQTFSEEPQADGSRMIQLAFFAPERTVLHDALRLCGLHAKILVLFDECFDEAILRDAGWKMLKATFDELGAALLKELPPHDESTG